MEFVPILNSCFQLSLETRSRCKEMQNATPKTSGVKFPPVLDKLIYHRNVIRIGLIKTKDLGCLFDGIDLTCQLRCCCGPLCTKSRSNAAQYLGERDCQTCLNPVCSSNSNQPPFCCPLITLFLFVQTTTQAFLTDSICGNQRSLFLSDTFDILSY